MNSFHFSVFAALAVFISPIFSQVAPGEDKFKELFLAKAPTKTIIAELMGLDPSTNYDHLKTIQAHIKKNDDYAEYSKSLLAAAQKIFDHMLREIQHDEGVDVVKFIDSAYKMANGLPVRDLNMLNLILKLNMYLQNLFEKALEEAKRNIMGKLLGVIDEPENKIEATAKKEADVAEKEPPKKRPQIKKSKSSVSDSKTDAGAAGERKIRRSKISKPSA